MAGLLSGLEKLGLKDLENMDVFEEEKKKEGQTGGVPREEAKEKGR